jgi:uncharacterized phage protein gp47/JayE
MAFQRPTLQEIVTRIQADFVSRLSLTGAVLRRSVIYVLARVMAGASHMLHGHLEFLGRQLFPDQSEAEYLERQASLYGLTRIAATYAAGNVVFTGTNSTVIPAGTLLRRADGVEYETDADGTIASGTATVAVTATTAGENGNADEDVSLALDSPISGLNSAGTVAAAGLIGGLDEESDDALRVRLLARMASPPHGGNADDYIAWSKEVAGVTRAWVYPLELGAGTLTVRFMTDDLTANGIPSGPKVTEVQNHINAVRPVTADVTVVAPTAVVLNFTFSAISPSTAAVKAAVVAELTDLIRRVSKPGGTIYISQIREAISIAAGEDDYVLTSPSANVTRTSGQITTMGTVTWP